MLVNQALELNIRGLILIGRGVIGLETQLRMTAVGPQREAVAEDVDTLANFVLAVQGRTAQFEVNGTGFVLDVNFVVDIPALVRGGHLSLNPNIAGNDYWSAIVHFLEVGNGCKLLNTGLF